MIENRDNTGIVFNIQRYSIHDGPGIRTSVFLKGCFLRCIWCQNPESQSAKPELFFFKEKCTGCGRCVTVCPANAVQIVELKSITDKNRCIGTGRCAQICPNEARSLVGKEMTVQEVVRQIKSDALFYKRSNGGVTLTGGEPLFQPGFSAQVLALCQESGIHTAIETCGYASWGTLKAVLQHTDLILYDLKHMDTEKHQEYTGVPNDIILNNLLRIQYELRIPVWIRIPVIPGFNDSAENIRELARFISAELDKSVRVCLLAYHKLGESKRERMGIRGKDLSIIPPTDEYMLELRDTLVSYGLEVQIGG